LEHELVRCVAAVATAAAAPGRELMKPVGALLSSIRSTPSTIAALLTGPPPVEVDVHHDAAIDVLVAVAKYGIDAPRGQ
jgi:hypothetical protein